MRKVVYNLLNIKNNFNNIIHIVIYLKPTFHHRVLKGFIGKPILMFIIYRRLVLAVFTIYNYKMNILQ